MPKPNAPAPQPHHTPKELQVLTTLSEEHGAVRFTLAQARVPGIPPATVEMILQGLEAAGYVGHEGDLWWILKPMASAGTPVQAAATYIPGEDDVDPEVLAQGKGQEDVEARDKRDTNFGDRGGLHTSALKHPIHTRIHLAATGLTAIRRIEANTLEVFGTNNHKFASWEGKDLDAAIDDGTLDPRHIEASAVDYVKRALGYKS